MPTMNSTAGLQTSDAYTTAPINTSITSSPSPEASTASASTTVITSPTVPSTTSPSTSAEVTDPTTIGWLITTESPAKGPGGLQPSAIAGIVVAGVLVAVFLLCLAAYCLCKRLRRNNNGAILMKNLSFTKFRKKFNQQKQQKQKEVQDKRTLEEPQDLTYIENSESRGVYQNMPHDKKERKKKPKDYKTHHDDTYVNVSKVTEATPAVQNTPKQTLHQEPSTEEASEYYNLKHKKQPFDNVSEYYNLKQDKQHHQVQPSQGDCSPTDEVNDYYNVKKKPLRNKSEAAYLTVLPPEGATKHNPELTIYDPVGNGAQAPPSPQDGIYQNM